ncbi:MAG: c-type heme family protein [Methylococcales bacterium]
MIQQSDRLMNRQLDPGAARKLRRRVESKGIRLVLQQGVRIIKGEHSVEAVTTRYGEFIPCDTVVFCTGIVANVDLASAAGIRIAALLEPGGVNPFSKTAAALAVFSLLSTLAVGLIWVLPALQPPFSVTDFQYQVTWTDSLWKQVTGFSMLSLTLIGLLMSLRKRFGLKLKGEFEHWRLLHAILGCLALVGGQSESLAYRELSVSRLARRINRDRGELGEPNRFRERTEIAPPWMVDSCADRVALADPANCSHFDRLLILRLSIQSRSNYLPIESGVKKSVIWGIWLIVTASIGGCFHEGKAISHKVYSDSLFAVMKAERTNYTKLIIARLGPKGANVIKPDEHWQDIENGSPLPAQMFRATAESVKEVTEEFTYSLQCNWPINKQNGPVTDMEKEGLQFVIDHPGENFYGTETLGDKKYYTAVYADVAIDDACISCHNNHKDSPKTDFKLGVVIRVPL